MNLALALGGCTLDELDERMTESEFNLWSIYSRRFFLPSRRSDLYGAQLALITAKVNGAKDVTIEDFMFDPARELDPAEQLKAAEEAFGFKPKKKKGQGVSPGPRPKD